MNRPETDEFFSYYNTYISLIEGNEVWPVLDAQVSEIRVMFSAMPEERGTFAYEAGKWSIKEVLSHLIDGERIFAYRILRISRGDETPIEGFEQDGYIELSNANNRSFAELMRGIRPSAGLNLLMLRNISKKARGVWVPPAANRSPFGL